MATLNPNSTNCTAYTGSSNTYASPDTLANILAGATEYTAGQKTTVSTDDTNFVTASGGSAAHLVRYRVTGSESQLDFTMKAQDSGPAESTLYMYVWNANSTAWELLTTAAPAAIRTLTGSKTTSISNYIDGSNDVHTLISAGNASSHTFGLYYSQLVTTVVSSSSSSNSSSSNSSSSNSSSSNSSSSNSSSSNSSSSNSSSSLSTSLSTGSTLEESTIFFSGQTIKAYVENGNNVLSFSKDSLDRFEDISSNIYIGGVPIKVFRNNNKYVFGTVIVSDIGDSLISYYFGNPIISTYYNNKYILNGIISESSSIDDDAIYLYGHPIALIDNSIGIKVLVLTNHDEESYIYLSGIPLMVRRYGIYWYLCIKEYN